MVHTLPYGKNEEGEVALGALSLITDQHVPSLFSTRDLQMVGGGVSEREETGKPTRLDVADGTCDVVIMNPPFTRPTNHAIAHVPVPSFAGFGTSADEQHAMSIKLKRYRRTLFGSGHAGLASNFMDLAHIKLKRGGVMALVLPFSFTSGASWKRARVALHKHYDRIRVIGIASSGQYSRAFSADTGMAECLVVATKMGGGSAQFTSRYRLVHERYLRPANALTKSGRSMNSRSRSWMPAGSASCIRRSWRRRERYRRVTCYFRASLRGGRFP